VRLIFSIVYALLSAGTALGTESWSLEAYAGNAYNLRSRTTVEQDGGYSRSFDGSYETRGFKRPYYWMLRAARWEDDAGLEVSLLHHKIYLTNPPDGVESLSVSHGFNILALSRAWRSGDWTWRLGAGPVITHAEAVINGVRYEGPYQLSGAALLAGGGRRFYFGKSAFLSLEAMLTAARARPRLEGQPAARIAVTNFALHGLAGVGYEF
jgi:hypothetical protein